MESDFCDMRDRGRESVCVCVCVCMLCPKPPPLSNVPHEMYIICWFWPNLQADFWVCDGGGGGPTYMLFAYMYV